MITLSPQTVQTSFSTPPLVSYRCPFLSKDAAISDYARIAKDVKVIW